jgi:transcriptional regulator with XRE-family HTH domain
MRAVRKQKRLSLQAVEAASRQEFKASVLGAYERGERAISVPRLQRLAKFYGVPVDQLLPRDVEPDGAAWAKIEELDLRGSEDAEAAIAKRSTDNERVTIDLTQLESIQGPERAILSRYLRMIQLQRQDFNGRVLTIRGDDLRAIGFLFETSPEGMRARLDSLGVRL